MPVDEDLLYQLVGERVKRARRSTGMSQRVLAERLDMSRTSIVNIEAGRQRPPLHVLWHIAEILETDAELLIPRHDEYRENGEPVSLTAETIEKIQQAASGDPSTRRDLTRFIERAVARGEEQT